MTTPATTMDNESATPTVYLCRGCGQEIVPGEFRYGDNWHADCHEKSVQSVALPERRQVSRETKARRMGLKPKRPTIQDRLVSENERQIGADVGSVKLYGAKGWYRQRMADCMPFTGACTINGASMSIGCWDTMTDCIRRGFTVERDDGPRGKSYGDWMVYANPTARPRAAK